jgi:polyhydroxybutyrate depolymerase
VHKIESGIERLSYCDADGNATLVVYLIDGLGHHWPGGRAALNPTIAGQPAPWFDATAKIWTFFSEGGLP